MLKPFFDAAMLAPGRQLTFRRTVVAHVLLVTALAGSAANADSFEKLTAVAQLTLILGIVEGAALVGWRLTQMPKSQALEFLLTSPVQPRRVFVAEALVGVARFALVWLAGVPVLCGLVFVGTVDPRDLIPLAVMPFVWGVVTAFLLTAWVYETVAVRRVGELIGLGFVLLYLVVGILAGEKLETWLAMLPPWMGGLAVRDSLIFLRDTNPFGVVKLWFDPNWAHWIAWEKFEILHAIGAVVFVAAFARAAVRLKGHYHDRHYKPIDSSRQNQSDKIGDRPLSWWAVRRVMEYSGRVNLWLAGGVSVLYAAYIVAEDQWPPWMGRTVFQLFEMWGGAAGIATALVVLAGVPAVFQYGLWDPTVQDRARRLELLLLTDLTPDDYWRASLAASWKRGRGYLVAAAMLWLALGVSGRNSWPEVLAASAGGAALWWLAFAIGFRAFATGNQTSGLASLYTLGLPLVLFGLVRVGWVTAATFVPTAVCYTPLQPDAGVTPFWAASLGLVVAVGWALTRTGLRRCDTDLRAWYDANHGAKAG